MVNVARVYALPPNMGDFIADMAPGLSRLYGDDAGADYLERAGGVLAFNAGHPAVMTFVAHGPGGEAQAIAMTVLREGTGSFSMLHVLPPWRGQGVEDELVRVAVAALHEQGAESLRCEVLPLCPLRLDAVFAELGFCAFPRRLMGVPLDSPLITYDGPMETISLQSGEVRDASAVIIDAYTDHCDVGLHPEVSNRELAQKFLLTVLLGGFGESDPAWCRRLVRSGQTVGLIAGCRIAPRVGFVLQVAVKRATQGAGLGGILLRELAQAFRDSGLQYMALGVTTSNPARRLYERLGFAPMSSVTAYVWKKDTARSRKESTVTAGA